MKKIALYARVSTDKQADSGVSLEAQQEKIRAMAVVQGAELVDLVVDAGESAKSLSTTLSGRVARVSAAIDTNNADVTEAQSAKVVRDQVTASLTDVETTTAQIAKDDPEVGSAMDAESSCGDLQTALSAAAS